MLPESAATRGASRVSHRPPGQPPRPYHGRPHSPSLLGETTRRRRATGPLLKHCQHLARGLLRNRSCREGSFLAQVEVFYGLFRGGGGAMALPLGAVIPPPGLGSATCLPCKD